MNLSQEKTQKIEMAMGAVEKIIKENPAITHINLRREDGVLVDVPVAQVEITLKRHPNWIVEDGGVAELRTVSSVSQELPVMTVKPSEEGIPPSLPQGEEYTGPMVKVKFLKDYEVVNENNEKTGEILKKGTTHEVPEPVVAFLSESGFIKKTKNK